MNQEITTFRQGKFDRLQRNFNKAPYRKDIDTWLTALGQDMISLPVDQWWLPLYRNLKQLPEDYQEKGRAIEQIAHSVMNAPGSSHEHVLLATVQAITNEFQIGGPYEQLSAHEIHSVSLEEITAAHPEILDQELVLPPKGAAIKGGGARRILKYHANSSFIQSEEPLTDIDYVVTDVNALSQMATNDIVNMEFKFGKKPEQLITQADVNMNACLVTDSELIFTAEAFKAAQTGHIQSNYHLRRGFYGDDFLTENGKVYPQPMQVFRLMKLVAEGRASSFDFPENSPKGLESNWLGIFRRYRQHPNFVTIGQNYFLLANQMGIQTFGEDFMDTVTTMFTENPRYPVTSIAPLDPAYYYVTKLLPHVQDYYRSQENPQVQEVTLPEMKKITLPEDIEIDTETIHQKHVAFEEKLANRQ